MKNIYTKLKIKVLKHYYVWKYGDPKIRRAYARTPLASIRKRYIVAIGCFGLISILAASIFLQPVVNAKSYSLASQDIMGGHRDFNQVQTGADNKSFSLQRGDIGQWQGGDGMQMPTTMVFSDTNLEYGPNNSIYMLSGRSGCNFTKYEIELQTWSDLTVPPIGCGYGSVLVYDGTSAMYYLPGNNYDKFFKYDIGQDQWSALPSVPGAVGDGAIATFVKSGGNSAIYLMRGNSAVAFLQFSFQTQTWTSKAPFPTSTSVDSGMAIVWDKNNSIYAISNSRGEFKRYSISSDSWANLTTPTNVTTQDYQLLWINNEVYSSSFRRDNNVSYMTKYNPTSNAWTTLATPPIGQGNDFAIHAATDGTDNIYTIYGYFERPILYRYQVSTNQWIGNAVMIQDNSFTAGQPIYDGGQYAYYIGGTNQGNMDKIWRKDLTTGVVTRIGTQVGTTSGISGAHMNGALYTLQYYSGAEFRKYDITTNLWTDLAAAPFASNYGSDIINGGDGFVYVTFAGRANFYKYSEAGGWQPLANMPQGISEGSQITRIGRILYVLVGANTQRLLQYNMDTNVWSYATDTPKGANTHGAFLTGDGTRYLYAGLGTRTDNTNRLFYRYDTVATSWSRMADLPQNTQVGSRAFYQTTTGKVWVTQGYTHFNMWSWTPTSANFVSSGNWYSKSLDMKYVKAWQSLALTSSGSGTISTYTRTSDNGRIWSDWLQVAGTTIGSEPKRYIQIKVNLSGGGTTTPTVTGITLNYDQEVDPPNLPSQFSAYDTKNGTALTSGTTYEHQHPYFSWQGASDNGGSGVAGYYVYFGTDSNADPAIDGEYQTQSEYTVTTAMNAGSIYYVKLKVKDQQGNVSDASTYFSYRYFYISPPGSLLTTSQTEFSQGTNTGVDIAPDGSMGLVQQTQGVWATGTMKMMPNNTFGPAMAVAGDYLYVLRGNATTDFWRYNLLAGIWETKAVSPVVTNSGSALSWDGGNYLYALGGNSQYGFNRYNIQNDTWEVLPSTPGFVQPGSDMQYIGGGKLAMMLSGGSEFYIFDIATRGYTARTGPPITVNPSNTGSGMWFDGSDTLYVNFGPLDQSQPNRKSLVAYSLSQDNWRTLSSPPHDVYYGEKNLVGDGKGNLYIFGNDYVHNRSTKNMAMKFNIASGTWTIIPDSPAEVVRGSTASDGKRYIYIIPNLGNSRKIVRYDTMDKTFSPTDKVTPSWHRLPWDQQGSYNWQAGQATSATYDGNDYMYAIGADEGTFSRFIKRSVTTGETTYLPSAPIVGIGGSLAYQNDKLYYHAAANRNEFYRFNQSDLSWQRMANSPFNVNRPGSQSLVALKDGTLLAVVGNGNRLLKYTPDNGAGTWASMANAPGTIYQGAVRYDGDDTVYVMAGNNTTAFYAYTVSTNTWATRAAVPANANFGAAMVFNNGLIYAAIGNNLPDMYIYNVANNTWQAGPTAPDFFRYGGDIIKISNEQAIAIAGQTSPDFWKFNFPAVNRAYTGLATHVSQPMMIDGLYDYAGIQAGVSIPANTKVEFWTRTSPDSITWGDWSITDEIKQYSSSVSMRVTSPVQKYTQVKVIMYSFDNLQTPKVMDYALDYYFDTTPPSNPTILNVYEDATKATVVRNNSWYNIPSPLIDWPNPGEAGGGTDGPLGSNLQGYYVYVGTDPTAIPQTAGTFITDTDYTPTLTESGTYYVRLQAVDKTGNIDPAVFSPFIYKFDNTTPTNPSLLVATPSGFTSTNNYTFQWPNGFDEHSGIAEYCYHTGALSGAFAIETCQTETELKDVPTAYQSGANVLYLRTKDIAGNYSPSYAQVSYYFSTDPPTPVTNLRAVPPTSEQNLFAFTWDFPTMFAGDPDQLSYCYTVNVLPTPTNTTCSKDMFISAFKAATQRGTNVLYMIAKDEAGNANWNNYASANFIANTVSPGIPLNMAVNDTSDSASERWSLTLTWDRPTFVGNGIAQYVLERSEDGNIFKEIGRVSNTAYVDLTVTPETTYYYRVKAADSIDNQGGPSGVAAKSAKGSFAVPPKIVSETKVLPSFDQATVNWVTDRASTSFVYYGTSPSQLSQSKGSLDLTSEHGVTITGLIPSTIYYYRVQSFDNNRSYEVAASNSQLYTFRTTDTARIFQVRSSDVGLDSAVISWETSVPTKPRIEYGPTSQYGFTQENSSGYSTSHLFKLSDLPSGARAHFRIKATTEYGSLVMSDDYTLTTIARPTISNVRFQPIEEGNSIAVRVTWTTNVPTSSDISYRALGTKKDVAQSDLVMQHDIAINDMAASTDYGFEIRGRDQYGNTAMIGGQNWKSGVDTKEPTISDLSVSTTTTAAVGKSKAQMIISWHTDEPTTTQVKYDKAIAKSLGQKTIQDTEPTVNHVVVISGLEAAQVYKIQPVSRDISGNTSYGSELVTVTPDIDANPLDIILNTLQKVFRL